MNTFLSVAIVVLMIILLFTLTDPFMYWMPDLAQMIALTLAAALVCVWAGFVMREHSGDEREIVHRMYAGRSAYLSGIAILTLALLVQGIQHAIDPWVPASLAAMILAKFLTRLYTDRHF
jgi:hypothetical protein